MNRIRTALCAGAFAFLFSAGAAPAAQHSAESNIGSLDTQDYLLTVD